MKLIQFGFSLFFVSSSVSAELISVESKVPGGDWNNPSTWVEGVVPANAGDQEFSVRIPIGSLVSMSSNVTITNLELSGTVSGLTKLIVSHHAELLPGSTVDLTQGIEFQNTVSATGDISSRGPLVIEHTGVLDQVTLTLAPDTPPTDAFLKIETGALLTLANCTIQVGESLGTNTSHDNGIINNGTLQIEEGFANLVFRSNDGVVEGTQAAIFIESEGSLSGTINFGSGSLTLRVSQFQNANIIGQGELRTGDFCVFSGGSMRASKLILEAVGQSYLQLLNVTNVIVGAMEVEANGYFTLRNAACWIQQETKLGEGSTLECKNSQIVCPQILAADSSIFLAYGVLDGSLDVTGGQLRVGNGMSVNGDVSLDKDSELQIYIQSAVSSGNVNPFVKINGTLEVGGSVSVEFGVDPNYSSGAYTLLHANTLLLAQDLEADVMRVYENLAGRLFHDVPNHLLQLDDIISVKHPWVWFIYDAGGDPASSEWDGNLDFDHDGISNMQEFALGSDPADPEDRPKVVLQLEKGLFAGVPSQIYVDLKTIRESRQEELPPVLLLISEDMVNWGILGLDIKSVSYPDDEPDFTFFRHFRIYPPWGTFFIKPYVNPVFIDTYDEMLNRLEP